MKYTVKQMYHLITLLESKGIEQIQSHYIHLVEGWLIGYIVTDKGEFTLKKHEFVSKLGKRFSKVRISKL